MTCHIKLPIARIGHTKRKLFQPKNPFPTPPPHATRIGMTQHQTPAPAPNTRKIPRQATSYMTTRDGTPPAPDDPLLDFAPVPHSRPRRNSITVQRQRAFISHLAATGIVTSAARRIGASMEALYKLRNKPGAEEFAAAWDAAVDRGVILFGPIASLLEAEGWRTSHYSPSALK